MAKEKQTDTENNTASENKVKTPTIEDLGKDIDPSVFAGVCARMKWNPGKTVTESEFNKAVKAFLESPIDGQPTDKKKENSK